ncbi:uncharacterized protein I303_102598 [Kwoniella dejecticola CBS 10117]|uniref:Uncharacterized protein n=1 Tax=Kwoniella dejecticola CBS 10117 TaxID=1296121 RepID=A0A1A6A969_9TREE|nr:uncharacterized protein I303_02612 [Kwoniella dejecticola CBS 10117]OBR86603.1 hypothetical protein I303_02612 [Kwoniella dejecticola CBS 10117]
MPIATPLPIQLELNALPIKSRTLQPRLSYHPLPIDIIRRISAHLADEAFLGTVSNIQRASKEVYLGVTPILYRCLHIKHRKSDRLLSFTNHPQNRKADIENDAHVFEAENDGVRRLEALKHVRRLIIHHIPSDDIAESFFQLVRARAPQSGAHSSKSIVFPHLTHIELSPDAVEQLRTWVSTSNFSSPFNQNPLFLETLSRTSGIRVLCMTFKSLLSQHWEEYRDLTLIGQYQLLSRIQALHTGNNSLWRDSLRVLNVHDISHQLVPTLPGVENSYFFSPHIIGTEAHPILVGGGKEACYFGGIDWTYRSWQIGKSIKSLFPSDLDKTAVQDILETTQWRFVGPDGQIKVKLVRDEDDDENGIPYKEVISAIKSQIRSGIPQELSAGQGWDDEQVEKLFGRIKYVEGVSMDCGLCECDGDSE